MPKGDRENLKADPDDGTTPMANLLLEALAVAPLSGAEKGAVIALARMTYGWTDGHQRYKSAVLSHDDWRKMLMKNLAYVARVLRNLTEKRVLIREDLGQGKGYGYTINTRVNEWVGGKLIGIGLTERFSIPSTKKHRVHYTNKSTPLATNLHSPKETTKEILNKSSSNYSNPEKLHLLETFESNIENISERNRHKVDKMIEKYPHPMVYDAIREACVANRNHVGYVEGILETWEKDPDSYERTKLLRRAHSVR